jgi:hypothetical protein
MDQLLSLGHVSGAAKGSCAEEMSQDWLTARKSAPRLRSSELQIAA